MNGIEASVTLMVGIVGVGAWAGLSGPPTRDLRPNLRGAGGGADRRPGGSFGRAVR